MIPSEKAVYLYCFARPDDLPQLSGAGIGSYGCLMIEEFASVSAVVSEVSLEAFCGPQADQNLQDIAWLAPRACLHEKVIEQAMQYSPVLPARFGTIFSSRGQLQDYAREHCRAIAQFLDRVAGQEEWGVKALLEHRHAKRFTLPEDLQARLAKAPPGRRYIEERRIRTEADRALRPRLKEVCRGTEDRLRKAASDVSRRRVVDKSGVGEGVELIMNWAFLVARNSLATFKKEIESANRDCADVGLALSLTGPWPPYSFAPALLEALSHAPAVQGRNSKAATDSTDFTEL